jgi:hypothetical protein
MVFTLFVGIIFLGLDFHYYDEGSSRFRTSVAQGAKPMRDFRLSAFPCGSGPLKSQLITFEASDARGPLSF